MALGTALDRYGRRCGLGSYGEVELRTTRGIPPSWWWQCKGCGWRSLLWYLRHEAQENRPHHICGNFVRQY